MSKTPYNAVNAINEVDVITNTALSQTTAPQGRATEADQLLPRTFGVKDIFTCINLLGGIFAIIYCIQGNIRYAAYAFLLGFVFGDALDGTVARLTHTGNCFGKEFDAISDHLAQCIAPAMIVFVGYRDISFYLAAALASLLIITGSIRHARASVSPVNFSMSYMGLPRTASALIVVSFLNSALFIHVPGGRWVGAVLLPVMSVAHILPLPFRTHRGRKLEPWIKVAVLCFFASTLAALIFFPKFVFDITFVWTIAYALMSWATMKRDERRAFFMRAKEWAKEVRMAR